MVALVAIVGFVSFLGNLKFKRLIDIVQSLADRETSRTFEILVYSVSQFSALSGLGEPKLRVRFRSSCLSARLSADAG